MVKSFVITAVAGAFLSLAACSPADGTVAGCATSLYGTFDGPDGVGSINGFLRLDGTMDIRFFEPDDTPDDLTDNVERQATMMVAEDGTMTTTSAGALTVSGALDLDTCEGTGTWDYFGTKTGTWQVGRYHTGF